MKIGPEIVAEISARVTESLTDLCSPTVDTDAIAAQLHQLFGLPDDVLVRCRLDGDVLRTDLIPLLRTVEYIETTVRIGDTRP